VIDHADSENNVGFYLTFILGGVFNPKAGKQPLYLKIIYFFCFHFQRVIDHADSEFNVGFQPTLLLRGVFNPNLYIEK
jgi:hypothetical protein